MEEFMNFEEYKKIFKNTFSEEYPIYYLESFIKKLSDGSIIYNDKRKNFDKELLDLTQISSYRDKIKFLFEKCTSIIKKCEEFEYERAYRYSYIYRIKKFDINVVTELIKKEKIVPFTNDDKSNDRLDVLVQVPTCKYDDKEVLFKFNIKLRSNLEDEEALKHVVLVRIDRELNTLEVRQDAVPIKYQDNDFYIKKLKEVRAWIISYLKCDLEIPDFQAISKYIKKYKCDEVKIAGMKLERNGMTAELDSGKNKNQYLPILDELRQLIDSNEIFTSTVETKTIKTLIEDFISDIEDNSMMAAAKIFWKSLKYEISSFHDKVASQECFIRWNKTLKDKESMDYVTRYLIECENELRKQIES